MQVLDFRSVPSRSLDHCKLVNSPASIRGVFTPRRDRGRICLRKATGRGTSGLITLLAKGGVV